MVGVTSYGLMKIESRRLPETIHEDEHIGGVVYGQYEGGSGMLVATDHRILFIDRKPLFLTLDEISYEAISGVRLDKSGFLNSVTLHTKLGDYTIRYANYKCSSQFVRYIENMRLEKSNEAPFHSGSDSVGALERSNQQQIKKVSRNSNDTAMSFLRAHEIGVLSTIDRTGTIHGTPVYYRLGEEGDIYIMSKQGTEKVRNIRMRGNVGFTVFDENKGQTVHIHGVAEFEGDQTLKDWMYSEIVKLRDYDGKRRLPPVAYLHDGSFMVIRLTPIQTEFTDYEQVARES